MDKYRSLRLMNTTVNKTNVFKIIIDRIEYIPIVYASLTSDSGYKNNRLIKPEAAGPKLVLINASYSIWKKIKKMPIISRFDYRTRSRRVTRLCKVTTNRKCRGR